MNKKLLLVAANGIFLVHCLVVFTIFFGWLFPKIWLLYMIVLVSTLVLDIILGYCILSKWEFDLRKKINPKLDYSYNFTSYYTRDLFKQQLSEKFITTIGFIFIGSSILINVYFHYLWSLF